MWASADTLNLDFSQIYFGINNKSRLNDYLSLVLSLGGGVLFFSENFDIEGGDKNQFLKIGTGIEQKIYKDIVMIFNLEYDIAKESLFSGLGLSVGVKIGIPSR